jgi:hypothetical protein
MDVLCLGRVPAVRCITGKGDGPEFSIRSVNDIRNELYLYGLFHNDRHRAVMATEEGRTYSLRLIMPVAFAIIEIATGDDCHQQYIDRYDQCKYFHNAGANIGQSSDLIVMKDCNTVVGR